MPFKVALMAGKAAYCSGITLEATVVTLVAVRLAVATVLPGIGLAESVVRIAVVGAAGVPVFLVAARLLGIEEAHGLSLRLVGAAASVLARVRRSR